MCALASPPRPSPGSTTVAIPFHDDRRTLATAVRSVLDQRIDDLEVLLVDDGSTDGSLDIARRFQDERVRVISDGGNRGLVRRLNQIACEAQGEWLARMDADDVAHPDRLARQLAYAEAHPSVDVVCTGAWIIDEHDRVVGSRHRSPLPPSPAGVLGHGFLLHPTVLARRSWFAEHPYDPAYPRAEDKELWSRTWQSANFARIEEPLLYYRVSSSIPLAAYHEGCATDRRLLVERGARMIGRGPTLGLLARSVAVEGATVAASRLGVASRLLRRRDAALGEGERAAAQALLDDIRQRAS